MEKIIKKLFFGTSALTLAAIAFLPLASGSQAFAATQAQQSSKFSVGTAASAYTAITTTPTTFYTGTIGSTNAKNKETNFKYGIGVASGQPSGTYSTTVTVTATTAN